VRKQFKKVYIGEESDILQSIQSKLCIGKIDQVSEEVGMTSHHRFRYYIWSWYRSYLLLVGDQSQSFHTHPHLTRGSLTSQEVDWKGLDHNEQKRFLGKKEPGS